MGCRPSRARNCCTSASRYRTMTRRRSAPPSQARTADSKKSVGKSLSSQMAALDIANTTPDRLEYLKSMTEEEDLVPDTRDPQQLRSALSLRVKQACKELGIPCSSSRKIADYVLDLSAEVSRKKPLWLERKGEDKKLRDPIRFLNKYWGAEIRSGHFYQADLREVDMSLFEAVRRYCRNHGMDPKDYLPPPLKQRSKKRRDQVRATSSKTARKATAAALIGQRARPKSRPTGRVASGMGARP